MALAISDPASDTINFGLHTTLNLSHVLNKFSKKKIIIHGLFMRSEHESDRAEFSLNVCKPKHNDGIAIFDNLKGGINMITTAAIESLHIL